MILKLSNWITLILVLLAVAGCVRFCNSEFMQIDACLDHGGCWDYHRHRCEMKDNGYCIRTSEDCTERQGTWQEYNKYFKMP